MIEERTEVSRETERQNVEGQIEEGERVKLLKDRVAQGDTEAMVLLAECYALGRETKQDRTQAETLISSSAKKGNKKNTLIYIGNILTQGLATKQSAWENGKESSRTSGKAIRKCSFIIWKRTSEKNTMWLRNIPIS